MFRQLCRPKTALFLSSFHITWSLLFYLLGSFSVFSILLCSFSPHSLKWANSDTFEFYHKSNFSIHFVALKHPKINPAFLLILAPFAAFYASAFSNFLAAMAPQLVIGAQEERICSVELTKWIINNKHRHMPLNTFPMLKQTEYLSPGCFFLKFTLAYYTRVLQSYGIQYMFFKLKLIIGLMLWKQLHYSPTSW